KRAPEIGQIVILSVQRTIDFKKWMIARYIQFPNTTEIAFHIDRDTYVRPEDEKYWRPLYEVANLYKGNGPKEEFETLYKYNLAILSSYEHRFLAMAKLSKVASNKTYPLDLYLDGIYLRSLSLIEGFITL